MTSGNARATALGAAWNYGAQAATVVIQLAYAGLTARLLGPEAFGAYGVALIVSSFVTLLATAGLPQTVSRMPRLDPSRLTGLLGYAVGVGAVAATVTVLTAGGWAWLWGVPGAAELLRLLAVSAFFAPVLAVGSGVLLRQGRFRVLAGTTFGCNVAGMAIGLAAVFLLRSAPALVVSPIVAQASSALISVAVSRPMFGRVRSGASVLPEMAYSLRMTLSGLLSYSAGNIGKLALGNGFGAATLGHWNRGEVVTSVPFYQAQNAVAQALYPQFRHDIDSMERSRRVWPDLLGLVAWLSVPLASVAAVVLPALIPLLFGPGWTAVAGLVPLMALIGGLQIVAFVLVGALEILARFRWIWAGHLCTLGVNALGGLMALVLHSVVPVLIGGLSSLVVMHGLHLWLCGRAGLFPVGRLLRHYAGVAAFSAGAAAAAYVVVHAPSVRTDPGAAALLGTALVGCAVALWRFREHLPVVRLARKYALIPV